MKKRVMALATAVICAFGFASCDDESLNNLIEQSDLAGHVTLYVSNAQEGQMYQDGDSIRFKSAVSNVRFDTVFIDSNHVGYDLTAGTLMVGTRDNAITHAEDLQPPFLGINLRDTNEGVHRISCPIDKIEFFRYLYESNIESVILSGVDFGPIIGNLFAVAYDEHSFYIGYSGAITINEFGAQNSLVTGSVNVNAIFITDTQLEELVNNEEQYTGVDLSDHFPTVTFTGEISSRRADIAAVVNALEHDAHIQE